MADVVATPSASPAAASSSTTTTTAATPSASSRGAAPAKVAGPKTVTHPRRERGGGDRARGDGGKFARATSADSTTTTTEPARGGRRGASPEDRSAFLDKSRVDDEGDVVATDAAAEEPLAEANVVADGPDSWPEPARKAIGEAQKQVQAAHAQIAQWKQAGQETYRENQALTRKVEWLSKAIEAAGFEIDPQQSELFDFRTQSELSKVDGEAMQKMQAEQQQKAAQKQVANVKRDAAAAATAAGLQPRAVEVEWALAAKRHVTMGLEGPLPTVAEVVVDMKAKAQAKQAKTNSNAPALVRQTATQPAAQVARRDRSINGRVAFMGTQGHDLTH